MPDRRKCFQTWNFIGGDPTLANRVDWHGIKEMQTFPSATNNGDQMGGGQHIQVLGDGLSSHADIAAQLAQRLAVAAAQLVQQ